MYQFTRFFQLRRKMMQILMLRINPIKFALYGIKLGKQPRICNHVYLHVHPKSFPENVVAGGNPCRVIKEMNMSYNPR
jgi:hypothetical protein